MNTDPNFPDEDSTEYGKIGMIGHAGSYIAYDIEDWEPPKKRKKKLPFGFCIERANPPKTKRKRKR